MLHLVDSFRNIFVSMRVYEYGNLLPGLLLRRKNRFVSEVLILGSTDPIDCYMANPGSMLGMCVKGAEVRLSVSLRESRRLKHTVEAIKIRRTWIGCNTHVANEVVATILQDRSRAVRLGFPDFESFRREIRHGNSRFDFELDCSKRSVLMEVKTVTMASDWFDVETKSERASEPIRKFPNSPPPECSRTIGENKQALFPDCQSERARKHVEQLARISTPTIPILVYVIMRNDVTSVAPSDYCDPEYACALRRAVDDGLHVIGIKVSVEVESPESCFLKIVGRIPSNILRDTVTNVDRPNKKRYKDS